MTMPNMTPERLAEELKPCPFCGETELYFRGRGIGQITCRVCGAEGPEKYSQQAAEECWNYRPIKDELLAKAHYLEGKLAKVEKERNWLSGVLHNSTGVIDGKKYDVSDVTWLQWAEQHAEKKQ